MKNKNLSIFRIAVIAFAFALVFTSCNKNRNTSEEEYLIKVDSIQLADTVKLGENFTIKFYGIIGENGCSSFSRFITDKTANEYAVQVIGKRKVGPQLICTEILPLLDGKTTTFTADSIGSVKIKVINPGVDQSFEKEVVVIP
ncbi:MAG: hypothetical protein Q8T08_06675 [Ignavibacteria bacterium]|nr:hypothetical protein [Ignavibacteria bacterium]